MLDTRRLLRYSCRWREEGTRLILAAASVFLVGTLGLAAQQPTSAAPPAVRVVESAPVTRQRQGPAKGTAVLRDPNEWHPSTAYYLVAPLDVNTTYLVDDHLQIVHEWESDYRPALSAYLRDNGNLFRTAEIESSDIPGSYGGRLEFFSWHGALQWSLQYASNNALQHHDAILLPNGHVLMIAWETRTIGEAIDAGRRPESLPEGPVIYSDTLVEMDPQSGAVTWTWRIWDHLVPRGARVADYPGRFDPNLAASPSADWTHVNSVAYNADLDEVLVSSRNLSEIWIIDHGTTTEEAAGHTGGRRGRGGDLLYRWGNPAAYGASGPRQLFGQHNAQWIPAGLAGAGHILLFNNGEPVTRPWSTAVEIVPPLQADGLYTFDPRTGFGPASPVWEYTADPPESLFGSYASGVQRLKNGNTLIAVTETGRFREVRPDGTLAADYQLELNGAPLRMFRVVRLEPDSPDFASWRLEPTGQILGQVLTLQH
jgi:hypothetical protein